MLLELTIATHKTQWLSTETPATRSGQLGLGANFQTAHVQGRAEAVDEGPFRNIYQPRADRVYGHFIYLVSFCGW